MSSTAARPPSDTGREAPLGAARWAPLVVALGLTIGYLIAAPHTGDLAAQLARAELFRRSGYVPFWTGWFGGIPTTTYSLITPPLLGWLGPVLLGGLTIFATGVVAVALLRDAPRPTAGATFFVIAATLDVISGRTTFAVGAVLALAALVAAERRRLVTGVVLAALATAASPVAGVLLLVVVAALLIADPPRRRVAAGLGAGVVVTLAALEVLAGGAGGGYEPLSRNSILMTVGTTLLIVIVPVSRRVRAGAVVAIAFLLAVYFIHSPIGANATRIAVLGTAPTLVAAARLPRKWLVLVVAVASFLPLAQLHNDYLRSRVPDFSRAYVAPLLAQLEAQPGILDHRVELVDTATRWPSTYVLPHVALARGWERQTDEARNSVFYDRGRLTPSTFRAFLDRNAVGYVAVPIGVRLDFGTFRERFLIRRRLPYLHRIWSNANWRLYAVEAPTPIVAAPATVDSLADTGLTLTVPTPGTYAVRMQWSPYLVVGGGRVRRAPDGEVILHLTTAGSHRLHAVWRWP